MTKVVTGGLRVNSQNIMLMNCLHSLELTLCILMDSSFWFDTINLVQSIVVCTYPWVSYILKKYCILLSGYLFYLYSLDPDEMQQHAAFHLGLHCLQTYLFKGFSNTKD